MLQNMINLITGLALIFILVGLHKDNKTVFKVGIACVIIDVFIILKGTGYL